MPNRRRVLPLVIVALSAALCGCAAEGPAAEGPAPSDSPASSSPTPTPTPTPSVPSAVPGEAEDNPASDLSFSSVDELRAAVQAAGVDCSVWTREPDRDPVEGGWTEGGWCDQAGWGLSIYPSRDALVATIELSDQSLEPQPFLYGADWTLTRGYEDPAPLATMKESIGGELWFPGDAYPQ